MALVGRGSLYNSSPPFRMAFWRAGTKRRAQGRHILGWPDQHNCKFTKSVWKLNTLAAAPGGNKTITLCHGAQRRGGIATRIDHPLSTECGASRGSWPACSAVDLVFRVDVGKIEGSGRSAARSQHARPSEF